MILCICLRLKTIPVCTQIYSVGEVDHLGCRGLLPVSVSRRVSHNLQQRLAKYGRHNHCQRRKAGVFNLFSAAKEVGTLYNDAFH
ncbi:hypothetical protein FHW04_000170 [Pantoea sp. AN62]